MFTYKVHSVGVILSRQPKARKNHAFNQDILNLIYLILSIEDSTFLSANVFQTHPYPLYATL